MKSEATMALERSIRRTTTQTGTFGCPEVTIGFFGKERVDYMTYNTHGVFRCFEIKVSVSDFHSDAAVSFVGHYNYYVMPRKLYEKVKDEIPQGVGVYVGNGTEDEILECVKTPRKKDLSGETYSYRRSVDGRSTTITIPYEEMLRESFIRSLARDSEKLAYSERARSEESYKRQVSIWKNRATRAENKLAAFRNYVAEKVGEEKEEKWYRKSS